MGNLEQIDAKITEKIFKITSTNSMQTAQARVLRQREVKGLRSALRIVREAIKREAVLRSKGEA